MTQSTYKKSNTKNPQQCEDASNGKVAYMLMRPLFALIPFIAGVDKFFHLITNWDRFLSPYIPQLTRIPAHDFMLGVGVCEIIIGLMVAFKPRIGVLMVMAMFIGIMLDVFTIPGEFHIAMLDLSLCVCSVALYSLLPSRIDPSRAKND